MSPPRRRTSIVRRVRLAWMLALLLPAGAAAEGPYRLKEGARGPLCVQCHSEIQDQMKLASVHTPVRDGDCIDCHNPHASTHGQLLSAEPAEICAACHEGLIPAAPVSLHAAVTEGGCTTCHDPHASANPNNLLAAGNELCYACHAEIETAVTGSAFQHPPAVDDCLNCHNPHASAGSPFLLRAPVGELCAGCHDVKAKSFVDSHHGYPVAGSNCASCHDPHGSARSGILRAQIHQPVAAGRCDQCHQDASSPTPLERRRPGIRLCAGCHSTVVNEALGESDLHWPVVEGAACLNCHSPHASDEPALLVQPPRQLCGECHADVIETQEGSASQHPPVAEGECTLCHAPHASDHPFLMQAANELELCGGCHDWQSHSSHPIGPDVADPRNPNLIVDCSSCHNPHGSPFKGLTHLDPGGELCVQCHQQMNR